MMIELYSCDFVGDRGCCDPECWRCHSPLRPDNLRTLSKNLATAGNLCAARDPRGIFGDVPTWTAKAVFQEHDRRLAADLAAMGERPGWWRPYARRRHDLMARHLRKAHGSDLRTMLAAQDPDHRAIVAHLIGWKSLEIR
jgi:hypothetical protein